MNSHDMYQEHVLDHFAHPRNKEHVKNANALASNVNPLCGDTIGIEIRVKEGVIKTIGFTGTGCAISQASASIITEFVKGKKISAVKRMTSDDVFDVIGVPVTNARKKCALLAFQTIRKALEGVV
ncbi:Fe-S cluster protein [archaeon CG10_big_fil_rev_8_21_14_0_10_43_11]|nr:MAG: Fe-S cluster protein [archaeon CG10_big_fil_rev_8_21_14_0_10_43_11]